jgi:hypothetical protein
MSCTAPTLGQKSFGSEPQRIHTTRGSLMPLWNVYHPVNALSIEDRDAMAVKITDI